MRIFLSLIIALLLLSPSYAQGDADMSDQAAINLVVNRLFSATDAKAWDTVGSLFTEEIDVDFSSLGAEPARIPSANLVAGWEQGLHAQKESHHMTSNHIIAYTGDDSAVVTAQGYAYNRLLEPAGAGFWEVWGVYTLPLTRNDDGWKLTGITFNAKYSQGDATVPGHVLE